ncbi:MAG TPA: PhzF family phenazine biosynthesis protein [Thermomicrobiales bacterium]|nr:PhzF family phenazine biosynthesis protein [Thermomicrobiales bacterium]
MRAFTQVDVFTDTLTQGNPVAVVHDADGLSDEQMAAFSRWTNLSETTFLLAPTDDRADYRLRIFTPGGELPFAGYPTLGSARAWLEAGNAPHTPGTLIQECGTGLVELRKEGDCLAFAAPPLLRDDPVEPDLIERIASSLRIDLTTIQASQWIDNGPGWIGVLLADAETVLALDPDFAAMGDLAIGVIGPDPDAPSPTYETRAFVPGLGVPEDPVTGSLAAGFAIWLIGQKLAPASYTVHQGAALGRHGIIQIDRDASGTIWVGGNTVVGITGHAAL